MTGYSTMTSTAILYAKTYLKMESTKLIIVGIITPLMGIMGALMFSLVQRHLRYFSGVDSNLKILKSVVIPTCAIPLYISTSVLFGSHALSCERDMYLVAGFFGECQLRRLDEIIRQLPWLFYAETEKEFLIVLGLFYGAFQSYSRAVYTELLPPGQEARWNSLFSLTAKSVIQLSYSLFVSTWLTEISKKKCRASSCSGPLVVGIITGLQHIIYTCSDK